MPYSEIRRHPRLEKKIKGEYRFILPENRMERYPLETETISGGGLMFISPQPIREGSHLEFKMMINNHPIEFTAKAVWSREHCIPNMMERRYATGFQFTIITQEDIKKLLMS